MFHEAESPQFPGELEGREDGVLGGESDEAGGGERAVRVDPRSGVPQGVFLAGCHALVTAASGKKNHYHYSLLTSYTQL